MTDVDKLLRSFKNKHHTAVQVDESEYPSERKLRLAWDVSDKAEQELADAIASLQREVAEIHDLAAANLRRAVQAESALIAERAKGERLRKALSWLLHDKRTGVVAREHIRAALADAPAPSPVQPDKWKTVPAVPTEAMLEAALDISGARIAPYEAPREGGVPMECDISDEDAVRLNESSKAEYADLWQAMVAAAPATASPSPVQSGGEPKGCPTPGACSCPSRNAVLEEAAKVADEVSAIQTDADASDLRDFAADIASEIRSLKSTARHEYAPSPVQPGGDALVRRQDALDAINRFNVPGHSVVGPVLANIADAVRAIPYACPSRNAVLEEAIAAIAKIGGNDVSNGYAVMPDVHAAIVCNAIDVAAAHIRSLKSPEGGDDRDAHPHAGERVRR